MLSRIQLNTPSIIILFLVDNTFYRQEPAAGNLTEVPLTVNKISFDSAAADLTAALIKTLLTLIRRDKSFPVILCIGSDRLTGDSLGPLVGHHLTRLHGIEAFVYGTLECPVTARNLTETVAFIKANHARNKIIVVDASLGQQDDIGVIRVQRGGIYPGAGIDKVLPRVGDIGITAVVNTLDGDRRLLLAGTRLSLVYRLSHQLADALSETCKIRESIARLYA